MSSKVSGKKHESYHPKPKAITAETRKVWEQFKKYCAENHSAPFLENLKKDPKKKYLLNLPFEKDITSPNSPWDDRSVRHLKQCRDGFFESSLRKIELVLSRQLQISGGSFAESDEIAIISEEVIKLQSAFIAKNIRDIVDLVKNIRETLKGSQKEEIFYEAFASLFEKSADFSFQKDLVKCLFENRAYSLIKLLEGNIDSVFHRIFEERVGELQNKSEITNLFQENSLPDFSFLEIHAEALSPIVDSVNALPENSMIKEYLRKNGVLNEEGIFPQDESLELRKSLLKVLQNLARFSGDSSCKFTTTNDLIYLQGRIEEALWDKFVKELEKVSEKSPLIHDLRSKVSKEMPISEKKEQCLKKIAAAERVGKNNPASSMGLMAARLKEKLTQIPLIQEISSGFESEILRLIDLDFIAESESSLRAFAYQGDLEFLVVSELACFALEKGVISEEELKRLGISTIYPEVSFLEEILQRVSKDSFKKALHQKIESFYTGILEIGSDQRADQTLSQKFVAFKKTFHDLYEKTRTDSCLKIEKALARKGYLHNHFATFLWLQRQKEQAVSPSLKTKGSSSSISPKSSPSGVTALEERFSIKSGTSKRASATLSGESPSLKASTSPNPLEKPPKDSTAPKKAFEEKAFTKEASPRLDLIFDLYFRRFKDRSFSEQMGVLSSVKDSSLEQLGALVHFILTQPESEGIATVFEFMKQGILTDADESVKKLYENLLCGQLFLNIEKDWKVRVELFSSQVRSPFRVFLEQNKLIIDGTLVQNDSILSSVVRFACYKDCFERILERETRALREPISAKNTDLTKIDELSSEIAYKRFCQKLGLVARQYRNSLPIDELKTIAETKLPIAQKIADSQSVFQTEDWQEVTPKKKSWLFDSLSTISCDLRKELEKDPNFLWLEAKDFIDKYPELGIVYDSRASFEANFDVFKQSLKLFRAALSTIWQKNALLDKTLDIIQQIVLPGKYRESQFDIQKIDDYSLSFGLTKVLLSLGPKIDWIKNFETSLEVEPLRSSGNDLSCYQEIMGMNRAYDAFYKKCRSEIERLKMPSWLLTWLESAYMEANPRLLDLIFKEIAFERYKYNLTKLSETREEVSVLEDHLKEIEKYPIRSKIESIEKKLSSFSEREIASYLVDQLRSFPLYSSEKTELEKAELSSYLSEKKGALYEHLANKKKLPLCFDVAEVRSVKTAITEYISEFKKTLSSQSLGENLPSYLLLELSSISLEPLRKEMLLKLDKIVDSLEKNIPVSIGSFCNAGLFISLLQYFNNKIQKTDSAENIAELWVSSFEEIPDQSIQLDLLRVLFSETTDFIHHIMAFGNERAKKACFAFLDELVESDRMTPGELFTLVKESYIPVTEAGERLLKGQEEKGFYDEIAYFLQSSYRFLGFSTFLESEGLIPYYLQTDDSSATSRAFFMRRFQESRLGLRAALLLNIDKFGLQTVVSKRPLNSVDDYNKYLIEAGYQRLFSTLSDQNLRQASSALFKSYEKEEICLEEFTTALTDLLGEQAPLFEAAIKEIITLSKESIDQLFDVGEDGYLDLFYKDLNVSPLPKEPTFSYFLDRVKSVQEFIRIFKEELEQMEDIGNYSPEAISQEIDKCLVIFNFKKIDRLVKLVMFTKCIKYMESRNLELSIEEGSITSLPISQMEKLIQEIPALSPSQKERAISILKVDFMGKFRKRVSEDIAWALQSPLKSKYVESDSLYLQWKGIGETFIATAEELDRKLRALKLHKIYHEMNFLSYLTFNTSVLDFLATKVQGVKV